MISRVNDVLTMSPATTENRINLENILLRIIRDATEHFLMIVTT